MNITFTLTIDEANYILGALGQRPFAEVADLIAKLKKDAEDQLQLLQDASAEMKVMAQEGKCWEPAEKEAKLPKWEKMPGYAAGMPFLASRFCGLWGRGT